MPAGTHVERGILQGFKEACAAVFFLTPDFRDEGYLAAEINYAAAEKRNRDEFTIIMLRLALNGKPAPAVPELLRQYVWKEPETELDALREIVRALPLTIEIKFKSGGAQNENENLAATLPRPSTQAIVPVAITQSLVDILVILSKAATPLMPIDISKVTHDSVQRVQHYIDQLGKLKLVTGLRSLYTGGGIAYSLSEDGRAYLFERGLLE